MAKRIDPEIWVPISLAQAERVVQQIVGSNSPGVSPCVCSSRSADRTDL